MRRALAAALRGAITSCLFSLFMGCAPHVGEAFLSAKAAGDRAYTSGRYDEAAGLYENAAQKALRPRDHEEALFLAAATYEREGAFSRAIAANRLVADATPPGERAPRAAFEIAYLEEAHGDPERGRELLLAAIHRYPNEGPAHRALAHYLESAGLPLHFEPNDTKKVGRPSPAPFIRTELVRLRKTGLEEDLWFAYARSLEQEGALADARDAYVDSAKRFPYPFGALFDDALWYASLLDERLGLPERAIDDLRQMLRVREVSTFGGSYERPRFSAAKLRIATLYRDRLHDDQNARRELHELYENHTTSTLRDDALWQEAELARNDGDRADACKLAGTLTSQFPDSRFAACVRSLCPDAVLPPHPRPCHDYVLRDEKEESPVEGKP